MTHTSKNRKMDILLNEVKREDITKTFRGHKKSDVRVTYSATITTDFGATINSELIRCYPSEKWLLPNGTYTSNKWDLYEESKAQKGCCCENNNADTSGTDIVYTSNCCTAHNVMPHSCYGSCKTGTVMYNGVEVEAINFGSL